MTTTDIFRALVDPTRRAVFERLALGESSVSDLQKGFAVSQPAISQHLAQLKQAGLVDERREGRRVIYRARPDGLTELTTWIDRYRTFWPDRVERLRDTLTRMDQ